MRKSLTEDLAAAARDSAAGVDDDPARLLAALKEEYEVVSDRRRRLDEAIGLLEAAERLKPDAAARLERYRQTRLLTSTRRMELRRQIDALRHGVTS
jgi:hypothetical protein